MLTLFLSLAAVAERPACDRRTGIAEIFNAQEVRKLIVGARVKTAPYNITTYYSKNLFYVAGGVAQGNGAEYRFIFNRICVKGNPVCYRFGKDCSENYIRVNDDKRYFRVVIKKGDKEL